MKKSILFVFCFMVFISIANVDANVDGDPNANVDVGSNAFTNDIIDPQNITIKDSYRYNRKESLSNDFANTIIFHTYYTGVRDALSVQGDNDIEKTTCASQDLSVWKNIVFDQYERNEISGDDYFFTHFVINILKICKIRVSGM